MGGIGHSICLGHKLIGLTLDVCVGSELLQSMQYYEKSTNGEFVSGIKDIITQKTVITLSPNPDVIEFEGDIFYLCDKKSTAASFQVDKGAGRVTRVNHLYLKWIDEKGNVSHNIMTNESIEVYRSILDILKTYPDKISDVLVKVDNSFVKLVELDMNTLFK